MRKLLLLLLLPISALGQTTRTVTLDAATDSIWAVPTWVNTTVVVNSVTLLDASGTVIATGSAGQVGFLQSQVSVTFLAVPAVTVAKVMFSGTQTPANGKWSGTFNITYPLPTPLVLVSGEIPTIVAGQGVMSGTLTASIVTPAPVVIPPPVVVPPPVVTPPPPVVTPPPPVVTPPATFTPNAVNDCISVAVNPKCTFTKLVTLNGDVWTLCVAADNCGSQNVKRNGVKMTAAQQPNIANILYINKRDPTYPYDTLWEVGPHGYAEFNGSVFTFTGHSADAGVF